MEALILLPQTLILLFMMLCGYGAFKKGWMDAAGWKTTNTVVVNVMNPFLMFSIISSYGSAESPQLLLQNLALVVIYYAMAIAVTVVYAKVRGLQGTKKNLDKLLLTFGNVGFMGVPLVRALYGDASVFYLLFYIVAFNVLGYTYGVFLASPGKTVFDPKQLLNVGFVSSVIAIAVYFLHIPIPAPMQSFFNYMGNAVVPVSMMVIGGSLAQQNLGEVFRDKENYIVSAGKLLLIPAVGIPLTRVFPFDEKLLGIFVLICAMPIASISGMLAEVYGHAGRECGGKIAMSTIVSVVTIPIVFALWSG